MPEKYWLTGEVPDIIDAGKQRFKHYKIAGLIEVSTIIEDETGKKEVRRETLSVYKLQRNEDLRNMVLDLLEEAGAIRKVETDGT